MPEPRAHTPKGVDVSGADVVVVYVSQGPLGAEVARSKLAAAGIPCALRYPSVGRIWGLTVDGLGRVQVVVPTAYVADAQELLADIEMPESDDL
jgi:hypothetical protein